MKHTKHLFLACISLLTTIFSVVAQSDVEVGFAGTSQRLSFPTVKQVPLTNRWEAKAWKGEKVQQQVVVVHEEKLPDVSVQWSSLATPQGDTIPSENLSATYVGFILTDGFGSKPRSCKRDRAGVTFETYMVADPLLKSQPQTAETEQLQTLWLSIKVPTSATTGIYSGFVEITAGEKKKLPITIEVLNNSLPEPEDWRFHLDLWQHPAAVARAENVPLWSDAHFEAMRPLYTMLAEAGQKVITASIVHEPWDHQTYDDYPSLIKWIKEKDGAWKYNYTLFDKYIEFVMSTGITRQINCYSMLPWKLSFSYYDENTEKDTLLIAAPGSEAYTEFWKAMLTDFEKHLKEKGWFNITTIAMDERGMKDMQAAIGLLKSLNKEWKISLAGNYHPEIEKDIYDYCLASNQQFPSDILQERQRFGMPSTYYTCCAEPYPNGFTFSPPDENVWIGIYAFAKNFDGYLRWAYNSWMEKPFEDSRFFIGPAGDTYLVYPFATSSIRFEKLIEGIQEFEKLHIVKNYLERKGDKERLRKLNSLLKTFDIQNLKEMPATQMTEPLKAFLNETDIN